MTESDDLERLIASLDNDPDPLHLDHTPSVSALAELGWPAAARVLDVMADAPDELTRMRAERVLGMIVDREYGFVAGQGFPTARAEDEARMLWTRNGDYRADASEPERAAAVRRWRGWLSRTGKDRP